MKEIFPWPLIRECNKNTITIRLFQQEHYIIYIYMTCLVL